MATAGRKPLPAPQIIESDFNHEQLAQDVKLIDEQSVLEANYSEDRDLANQLLGQIEMANTFSKLLTVTTLSKLQYIKEERLYRALKGKKSSNGYEFSGTWSDYCEHLGMSVEKVDQDLLNLKTFGEDALESMQRLGMGYRELRQYRQLPETQQQELIEAAKSGDKDTFLEVAEDLIAKHVKEKSDLTKKVTELELDAEAQGEIIVAKNKKMDEQAAVIHKLQNRTGDWHPRAFEIAMETTERAFQALQALDALDLLRDAILNEDFGDSDREPAIEAMACVYFDRAETLTARIAEIMHSCEAVFLGYKDKARPIVDVFGDQAAKNAE